MGILSQIIFLPILGMIVIFFLPSQNANLIRRVALFFSALVLLLSVQITLGYNAGLSGYQFVERFNWIPQVGIQYFLGVDGISVPMILITGILSFLACLSAFGVKERVKEFFALFLLLEAGMLGTFCSLDLILFYVFWEIVLLPMYFLIGIWGGKRREYATIKFFLYTLAGSVLMLIGFLALYFQSTPHTFDMVYLANHAAQPLAFQKWVFLALFFGFAIKVPIFPFHTWLPDAHVEAPTPISVILAGVLLKMGTYGFLRISFPLVPEGALMFAKPLAILVVIGIIYGGFCALAQSDFKKMVAYSSVSHMGFVLLGMSAFTYTGFDGAVLQMFNHGIITGGLFLLVGVLYDRAHTRDMNSFGGLGSRIPVYSGLLILFSMASLGLPGLSGFVGELLVLLGAFPVYKPLVAIACVGIVLGAAYLLYMIQRVLLGPLNPKWADLKDVNARELTTLIPLVVLTVLLGVYPRLLLDLISPTTHALVDLIGGATR